MGIAIIVPFFLMWSAIDSIPSHNVRVSVWLAVVAAISVVVFLQLRRWCREDAEAENAAPQAEKV
jgi:divalent metal cation (Fe/Co/Zn/Cd) transporter